MHCRAGIPVHARVHKQPFVFPQTSRPLPWRAGCQVWIRSVHVSRKAPTKAQSADYEAGDADCDRSSSSLMFIHQTIKITGSGSGLSRAFLRALLPGIIGRWHNGQYSLYRVNHSSRQWEWKAWEHRSPRTCASSSKSSRQIALS